METTKEQAQAVWDLDDTQHKNREVAHYMAKHGNDNGKHNKFTIGDVIEFYTGYNDDIRASASIKGINGNDIYVYNDCYWFPIQDDNRRKIKRVD